MDSDRRIVNKETGLVIDGSSSKPNMQEQRTSVTPGSGWMYTSAIRGSQETASETVPKLVENSRQYCLNTVHRFSSEGSLVIMFDATQVFPDNACWDTTFERSGSTTTSTPRKSGTTFHRI